MSPFQSLSISGCLHFRVFLFQGVSISGCLYFRVSLSGCLHFRVFLFQGVSISDCLYFRVSISGCLYFREPLFPYLRVSHFRLPLYIVRCPYFKVSLYLHFRVSLTLHFRMPLFQGVHTSGQIPLHNKMVTGLRHGRPHHQKVIETFLGNRPTSFKNIILLPENKACSSKVCMGNPIELSEEYAAHCFDSSCILNEVFRSLQTEDSYVLWSPLHTTEGALVIQWNLCTCV